MVHYVVVLLNLVNNDVTYMNKICRIKFIEQLSKIVKITLALGISTFYENA